jgi:hypothetical protein
MTYKIARLDVTHLCPAPAGLKVFEIIAFDADLRVHICSAQGNIEGLTIDHEIECDDDDVREEWSQHATAWPREFSYYGEELLQSVVCDVPEDDVRLALEDLEIERVEDAHDRAEVLEKIAEFHGQSAYC